MQLQIVSAHNLTQKIYRSAALARPGQPIGGIIVKGGKNPGGQMRVVQTNEQGGFEFTNMEKGNYSITTEANYYVDDETMIIITDEDCDGGSTAERKGWDGTVKGGSKAQDHNSSRSNKTAGIADNNPEDETTAKSIVNTTKSNTKDFLVSLNELDQLLTADKTSPATAIHKAKENSRQLRNAIAQNESISDKATTAVDSNFSVLLGSISSLGQQYSSISNTLKTKHDTAKNSVGNIR